jgi:hypothetical protein
MSEEVVYITLVDHSDANNLCYPSIALLSKECKCSKQTVINALRGLEAKGLITKETRVSENGTKKTNLYHVTQEPRNVFPREEDKTLYQAPEPANTVEPTHEPAPVEHEPHKREEYPTAFEQLWTLYPKHVAKMAAYKAWRKARVGMNSAFLLSKVQAFAAQCANTETRFIPNFATWLNGERWNDEYRPDPQQARNPATNAERNMQNLTQAMQSQTDLFGFQIEAGSASKR